MSNKHQDSKPEEKPAETKPESEMAKAVREGISEGIAMATAMAAKGQPAKAVPAPINVKQPCGVCEQDVRACKDKHRLLAVYPQNRKHGKYFQGVFLNGVRYLSNSIQHRIPVPADSNIEYLISSWEQNEDELSTGREVEHNSGEIGSGSKGFTPGGTNPSNSFR